MKKKFVPILAAGALIVVIICFMLLGSIIEKYTPSKEHMNLSDYYNLSGEQDVALILDNQILDAKGKLLNGTVYLDYETVCSYLNDRFYWDHNENKLLYTTATDLISADADSTSYYVTKDSHSLDHPIVKADAQTAYIAIDFLKLYSDFSYEVLDSPNRVILTTAWGDYTTAPAKQKTQLRQKGGIKSPILADIGKNTEVTVLETGDTWTKVSTAEGIIGYIKSKALGATSTKTLTSDYVAEEFTHIKKDFKINMAWHQITNADANTTIASVLQNTKGINVISPTWFYLNDNNGNIASLASSDYVNYCHNQGIEVWALVSNLENKNVDTTEVLTHTSKRQNLVNQIVSMAIQYNLDGINVDFESMNGEKVGDAFIEFIRELSIKCKNNGVVLSVDNYVPMSHTSFYNRKEQANFADYVVIMGYDEHYAGSPEAGSVASLSWVTQGVSDTLKEVPADQVILGMPFYTRVWEIPSESSSDDTAAGAKIPSKIYGMKAANDFLATHGATKTWLDDCGQNYSEFTDNDTTYKVWLEDSASAECRLKLVEEKKLAGASFWKLGFETSDIWDTVTRYIH